MTLGKLQDILAIPENPRDNRGDWSKVEADLGVALPNDYKEFIERYGSIYIADFLMLLNPFSASEQNNLLRKQAACSEMYQALKQSGEEIPYEFFPTNEGLIVVGLTDNGDMIFWKTQPREWTIVVNEGRGPDWFEFNGSVTEFIEGLISGSINCDIFPDDAFKI